MSISDRTKQAYLERARLLIDRFQKETSRNMQEDYSAFFEWLRHLALTWKNSTSRQYKASLRFFFKYHQLNIDETDLSKAFSKKNKKADINKKFGKRTSSQKAKKVDYKQWSIVKSELQKSCSPKAILIIKLIEASEMFGLRPVEWGYSEFISNGKGILGLRVKNAKATNNRSFGIHRTIWLPDIPERLSFDVNERILKAYELVEFFQGIKSVCQAEFENQETYEDKYFELVNMELRGLRVLLGQINKRLENKKVIRSGSRITLYSGRHQFAANSKKSGLELLEVAALMGHGALDTNEKYYGRKASGKSGFSVKADQQDTDCISERLAQKVSFTLNR